MEVELAELCEVVNGGRKDGGGSERPRPKIGRLLNHMYVTN